MQFTTFSVLACAAVALAAPQYGYGPEPVSPISSTDGNGINNGNNGCAAFKNGKQACCSSGENSSDGGLLGLNGLLGANCGIPVLSIANEILTCPQSQTQACCPTNNQTGLIQTGSICVPLGI